MNLRDGLKNLVANLGTSRDKASSSGYFLTLLSDSELQLIYRSSWALKKVVNIPARDAVKSWRAWEGEEAQVTAIEAEEARLDIKRKVENAILLARIFGGSAIYVSDQRDPSEPFDPSIAPISHLSVLAKREIVTDGIIKNPDDPRFNQPATYKLAVSGVPQFTVHPSRLAIFKGDMVPDEEQADLPQRGWGDSVVQRVMDQSLKADSVMTNVNSMTYESKVDIIKLPGLSQKLADKNYEKALTERFSLAGTLKGINGLLLMDKEEEHALKELKFAGLADIIDRHYQVVAAAADIPMTRFMGQSPAGLNSTGMSDLSNYYDSVTATQELDIQPSLKVIDDAIIVAALGSNPGNIWYNWRNLFVPTQKEMSEITKNYADAASALVSNEIFRSDQMSEPVSQQMAELGAFPGIEKADDIGAGFED